MTLEEKKAQARNDYITAREKYMQTGNNKDWVVFCDAKRICRLLGIRI